MDFVIIVVVIIIPPSLSLTLSFSSLSESIRAAAFGRVLY